MTNDRIPTNTPAPLSADSAFVVHLTVDGAEAPDIVCGRIEHITSGRAMRFGSVTELLGFMRQTVAMLALLAVVALPAWSKTTATCLTGSDPSVGNDAAQIAALRTIIDSACPCASFDGSLGNRHRDYLRCVRGEIRAVSDSGELRPQCQARVKLALQQSTCGRNPELHMLPCIETTRRGIACRIRTAVGCQDKPGGGRVACAPFSTCVDAADHNGDYRVDRNDSSTCVLLTATTTPTAMATATINDTATPSHTVTSISTHTATMTATPTSVPTDTATIAATATPTAPPTDTPTLVSTDTPTHTPTQTPTPTLTFTDIPTATPTTTPTFTPTAEAGWTWCAPEGGTCNLPDNRAVRFGVDGRYAGKFVTGAVVNCTTAEFGDPAFGVVKHCEYFLAAPTYTPTVGPCASGPIIPRVDINIDETPQSPTLPPLADDCKPQSLIGGGCLLEDDLDGTVDNIFDANATVDGSRCPGDPAPSYHWELFKPATLGGTPYSSSGITGYHNPVLLIRPSSFPSLSNSAAGSDVYWRVQLTVVSAVTGQSSVTWFRFGYVGSSLTLQMSTDCQRIGHLQGNECTITAINGLPPTEPT